MIADRIFEARDLVFSSLEKIRNLPVRFSIRYEEGEIATVFRRETLYTWTYWELLRLYPKTVIRKHHHINHALGGKMLNSGTHLTLCTALFRDIMEDNHISSEPEKEKLLEAVYRCVTSAVAMGSTETKANVMALDILDFIQVAHHPKIAALREEAITNPGKIDRVYGDSIKLLETEKEFDRNGLALAVRAKMVKPNQVTQCIMFRGFVSEVDGVMFPKPIWSNYLFGMRKLEDFAMDSRTAAKSHFYSDTILKKSEYTARKFRLFAMTVENLTEDDCGSTDHLEWLVRGPVKDAAGAIKYRGDLPAMIGKYYLDADGQYKEITGNETHLDGQIIKLRSPIYCKSHHPRGICRKCFGKLAANVSRFDNIGHLASITVSKDMTQSILSIKHVNTSSSAIRVAIDVASAAYLNGGADGRGYYINKHLVERPDGRAAVKLLINRDSIFSLFGKEQLSRLKTISLSRISSVESIVIQDGADAKDFVTIPTQTRGKDALLSREFLKFLENKSWSITPTGYYEFDLTGWDVSQPVLVTENREESFADLASRVESLILSHKSEKGPNGNLSEREADVLLQEVYAISNSKLWVNLVAFEVVVYALMVRNAKNYMTSRGARHPTIGTADEVTKHGSLGAALAYEGMDDTLTNPLSFYPGYRPDSPLDVFLTPQPVIQHYHPEAFEYRDEA